MITNNFLIIVLPRTVDPYYNCPHIYIQQYAGENWSIHQRNVFWFYMALPWQCTQTLKMRSHHLIAMNWPHIDPMCVLHYYMFHPTAFDEMLCQIHLSLKVNSVTSYETPTMDSTTLIFWYENCAYLKIHILYFFHTLYYLTKISLLHLKMKHITIKFHCLFNVMNKDIYVTFKLFWN